MSDEKNEQENKYSHLDPVQADKAEKAAIKLAAVKAVKDLSNEDSEWTLTQEILQEILSGYLVQDPNAAFPPSTVLVKELKQEIERRYSDEESNELKDVLLESVPSARSVRQWLKKEGWDDAVWQKIRSDKLFSPAKRSEVIQALHQRAVDKSDAAAKIYLTLSGDYVEKAEVNSNTVDTYRDIQKQLQRNKKED